MRRLAAVLAALALAAVVIMTTTGCYVSLPCSRDGGVSWTNGKVYQCADGTWQ